MKIFTKSNGICVLVLSLLALVSACSNPGREATTTDKPISPPDRVDVVYFYDSDICSCQIAPGDQIQGTLFINFNGDLISGKLTYQSVDLTDQKNAAIISKYGATSQSLFINLVRGGSERIIAMPEMLVVKDDDEALSRLIITRIQLYLDGEE